MQDERALNPARAYDALMDRLGRLMKEDIAVPIAPEDVAAIDSLLQDVQPRVMGRRLWVVVHPDGRMIDCNATAAERLGIARPGDRVDGLDRRLADTECPCEVVAVTARTGEVVLCRATRRPDRQHWLLEEVAPEVTPEFRAQVARLWRLTPTEAAIAEALLRGEGAEGIARATGRTIGTVRQVIKALLSKLDVHSQAQAVARLAMVLRAHGAAPAAEGTAPVLRRHPHRDAAGQVLNCWRFGEAGGLPVLFFHGAIFGIAARPGLPEQARLFGLDMLAPERPGYGETPLPEGVDPVALAVTRARAAMTAEGFARAVLLAHDVGTAYAFAFARQYPELVAGIVCAPATPPMTGWAQTADMPPMHRISAFAAQTAPSLMAAMIRLGLKRIEREGLRAIPRLIFADSTHDREALLRPEAYPVIEALYLSVTEQRARGFEQDMFVTNRNWSNILGDIRCPVRLLHGALSRTVSEAALRSLAAALPDARLSVIPDAGHTMPITHPTHAFREVLKLT
ncbi:alpha/beta fold hydrolase [Paracoccus bogoriensis]|uniref:alpha/beta fold hydrolase n=1 Tax=Paracoccus bogoriensis TaxID=242065 RepID=UPI001CA508AA|nr:alpha/beta fold hydrolase [Paracoccus bogoriensis]MBW7057329.1 alpha/beta fold hydrolase [Paracoccus bogoriensis]